MAWDYFGKAGSTMGALNTGSTNEELDRKMKEKLEPMVQAQAGRGGFSNAVVNRDRMAEAAQEIKDIDRTQNTIINDVPVFADTPTRAGTYALEMGRLADMETQGEEAAGALTTDPKPVDPEVPAAQDVPNPSENPGGYLAATNLNRGVGAGNSFGMPKIPTPPSPAVVAQKAMDEQGKQVMFDQNKIPEWYKSRAFSGGLLSFGLNLLSGNDLATSFSQAGQYFDEGFSKEKREAWANDLVEAGYDAQDIQRWIETGDNKDLPDPMEKKMRMQQYQLGAEQLSSAQYENTPEMRLFKQQMQLAPLEMQRAQMAQSAAQFNASHNLALRKLERDEMKAAGYGYNPITKKYEKGLGAEKPFEYKEGLAKAQNQYIRARQGMENYDKVLKEFGGAENAYKQQGFMGDMMDAATIDLVFSGDQTKETAARKLNPMVTKLVNQEREFLAPLLRKDSGSAISASEWKTTGEIYFPRPGDSAETVKRKADSRVVAALAMAPMASPQLKQALDMYTTGALSGLKVVGKRVYANDGNGWIEIMQ